VAKSRKCFSLRNTNRTLMSASGQCWWQADDVDRTQVNHSSSSGAVMTSAEFTHGANQCVDRMQACVRSLATERIRLCFLCHGCSLETNRRRGLRRQVIWRSASRHRVDLRADSIQPLRSDERYLNGDTWQALAW
jgi:hypothetical protein